MIASLVIKHDKKVHRFLEVIPGLLTWSLILAPIWLGIVAPSIIVYLITFLSVYWVYLAVRYTAGMAVGYSKYRKEMKVDWADECKKLQHENLPDISTLPKVLNDLRHLILIPAVNEPLDVLKESLDSILNQTFDTKKIMVAYTVEEKYAPNVIKRINEILGDRKEKFEEVLIYTHPSGIPGESIGAGAANRTWGAKHAVEHLQNSTKSVRNYIFSTIDADHVLDRQYIARLTHLYLTSDKRDNRFYSTALHLFNNNHWRVPAMMRIEADAVTLGGLSDWVVTKPVTKDTFSSYSCSLKTLIDSDYWDVSLGVDDTVFYWRAFFARNGDFTGTPHFIPYSADAVEGKNYINSYVSLYKQLLRWGWGVIVFPLSIKEFLINKKIPFSKKVAWVLKHFERSVLLVNIVFLMTFGFALLTLANPDVKQTNFAYSLPNAMSFILTLTLIFLIPGSIYRTKIATPVPASWPFWRKFLALMEGPMVILNLLTFSFFPFVEAQTRMLFGKKMKDLYYTQKVRKHK